MWHPFLARGLSLLAAGASCILWLAACADNDHQIVISVPEQRMVVLQRGIPIALYPVSTSRFGLGDGHGTSRTPTGEMEIAEKIGDGLPAGAVFKNRAPTGEVVAIDAPGRDAIVSRILWLRGLQSGNRNTYDRYIYVHGTPEERNIGRPVSYGCVRMRSRDVIALFGTVGTGAHVFIEDAPLAAAAAPLLGAGTTIPPPPMPAGVAAIASSPVASAAPAKPAYR